MAEPRDLSSPLSRISSSSSSSSSDGATKHSPPLDKWKKKGTPPLKCRWTDDKGRAASWRCRAVDPVNGQVRGWARRKGHGAPCKQGICLDDELLDHPKWKDLKDIPDWDAIDKEKAAVKAKEKRKKEKQKAKGKKTKEEKKAADAKKKEETFVKLPWWMKMMGHAVVKLPPIEVVVVV